MTKVGFKGSLSRAKKDEVETKDIKQTPVRQ